MYSCPFSSPLITMPRVNRQYNCISPYPLFPAHCDKKSASFCVMFSSNARGLKSISGFATRAAKQSIQANCTDRSVELNPRDKVCSRMFSSNNAWMTGLYASSSNRPYPQRAAMALAVMRSSRWSVESVLRYRTCSCDVALGNIGEETASPLIANNALIYNQKWKHHLECVSGWPIWDSKAVPELLRLPSWLHTRHRGWHC